MLGTIAAIVVSNKILRAQREREIRESANDFSTHAVNNFHNQMRGLHVVPKDASLFDYQ
jgi:hypothetical protein